MQNVGVTIFVATVLMGDSALAIPGLLYALEMNLVALLLIGWAHVTAGRAGAASQTA
jgi:predicted Na+-dependent transporter